MLDKPLQKVVDRLGLSHLSLSFGRCLQGLKVHGSSGVYRIEAAKEHYIYRALLILASHLRDERESLDIEEVSDYEDFGYMADCSRNAVLSLEAAKRLIEDLALMGYSNFQIYMEDTYELENQPYFGYFRGKYTVKELQEIENCVNDYGMDFIPCIQTLAHLSAFVKWNIIEIQEMRDVDDVLLIGSEGVYDLIDQMFKTLSQLKTRIVNIGMDEAHLVGLGRYLNLNGYQERSVVMCQHLERVLDIADRYGFKCQMWSDMFFQLLTKAKNYNGELNISNEVGEYLNRLKDRVQLIYWDYYQMDKESYSQKFLNHQKLADNIGFAGGAWKWIGFTPDNRFSMKIAPEAHQAATGAGVKQLTITGWGDNGGECSQFAVLVSLFFWAELAYKGHSEELAGHFQTMFDLSVSDFFKLDMANYPPSRLADTHSINPNRYLLYQDILCPLLDLHHHGQEDITYFKNAAEELKHLAEQNNPLAYLFETQEQLCQILAIKLKLSLDLRRAYAAKDKAGLEASLATLSELKDLVEEFHQTYSKQWLLENKIFGLDTIDIRLGGLKARIERAYQRVSDYLRESVSYLPELEVELLPYNDFFPVGQATSANQWHLIATASTIYTT